LGDLKGWGNINRSSEFIPLSIGHEGLTQPPIPYLLREANHGVLLGGVRHMNHRMLINMHHRVGRLYM